MIVPLIAGVIAALLLLSCQRAQAPPAALADQQPKIVRFTDDITVVIHPAGDSHVEVKAFTCLDEGFLEQVACSPHSRVHESLVAVAAKPSQIHAALLMAGFEPGRPGQWSYENDRIETMPPSGDKIDVRVRHVDRSGREVEHAVRRWIRAFQAPNAKGKPREFPEMPWVFGGSQFAPNPPRMGPGEHYVADMSGSIIGLVTFGDEVIGLSKVLSDQEELQPQEWEVNTELVPPLETPVTLVLRRWRGN